MEAKEPKPIIREELEKFVSGEIKEVLVGLTTARDSQTHDLQGMLFGLKKIAVEFDLRIDINLNFNYIYHNIGEGQTEKVTPEPA